MELLSNKKSNEVLCVDKILEQKLLDAYHQAKNNSLEQHFASIELQNFYYKYRDLDSVYLYKCIDLCKDDISKLNDIQKTYVEESQNRILSLSILSPIEKQQKLTEIKPFSGSIPAFKRLAIIYEKEKDYDNAINICDQAMSYYESIMNQTLATEFEERR